LWGWSFGSALVFGLSLSCASTVVLLKALGDRGLLDSVNGKIAEKMKEFSVIENKAPAKIRF
ncbi:hypothetical protein IAF30_20700, partial [Acinetobacter baumannii]|nr:hypothetical protein [Acinetobacter baumannii]